MKRVFLSITTFRMKHYYGSLIPWDNRLATVDMHRVLDDAGAKQLNADDKCDSYEAGHLTNRYYSPDEIVEQAQREWRDTAKLGDDERAVLLCGRPCRSPVEILDGPPEVVEQGNDIWRRARAAEGDFDVMAELCKLWDKLMRVKRCD